jgi:hypothetical protein
MEDFEKDDEVNKIISKSISSTGVVNYILENGSWLGDSFNYLPPGIIDKRETGIGATTLELECNRNSIIVLPTRYTAKSKASHNGLHYFGSDEGSSKINFGRKVALDNYLKTTIGFKKIIVVADSLQTLIEHLGPPMFKDYFILIDEIDSVQLDSSYRKNMEICIEFYKMFPIDKRAVVSATLIDFSDPDLQNIPINRFNYVKYNKGKIQLTSSEDPIIVAVEILIEKLTTTTDKIVFALNEITPLENIASYIVKNGHVNFTDIALLCGQNPRNKEKTEKYNTNGIQQKQLPCRVNFITSAYFTGFDICEPYHLIIVSDIKKQHTIVSELQATQIIGRCRKPHLPFSINFVFSFTKKKIPIRKLAELISSAEQEIEGLNCIYNKFTKHPLLKEKAIALRKMLISESGFSGYNFVKINKGGQNQISYLNIDAFLENQRTKSTVFKDKTYLIRYFKKESYTVNYSSRTPTITIELEDEDKSKNEFTDAIEFLKTKPDKQKVINFMLNKTGLPIQLCDFYILAVNVLGFKNTIARLEVSNTKKKIKELHNALIAFNTDKTEPLKRNILHDFPVGKTFANSAEYEKQVEITSLFVGNFEFEKFSLTKAKKLIQSFVEIIDTSVRNLDKSKPSTHNKTKKVKSHNPMKFKKCKPKNILI